MFTGTIAQARAKLELMTASSSDPALSPDELDDLLLEARRADMDGNDMDAYADFRASTAYALNSIVVPTTRNGHYYKVTTAGTTSTEPTWPTTSGGTVVSGTATFTEQGAANWTPTWDLNWAAAEGWSIKRGRAANENQYINDARGNASDFLYQHCAAEEEKYRNRIQASIPINGRRDWAA